MQDCSDIFKVANTISLHGFLSSCFVWVVKFFPRAKVSRFIRFCRKEALIRGSAHVLFFLFSSLIKCFCSSHCGSDLPCCSHFAFRRALLTSVLSFVLFSVTWHVLSLFEIIGWSHDFSLRFDHICHVKMT